MLADAFPPGKAPSAEGYVNLRNGEQKALTNRQKQALVTRNRIFEATMRLGMDSGFEKLTINDVCKEASVSVGTFYHYFRSIDAVIQEQYSAYDQYIAETLADSPLYGSSEERLWQLFSLKYNYVSVRGAQFIVRQYRGQFAQIETSNSVFYDENRIMHKTVVEILRAGVAAGEFSMDISPSFLANILLVFSRGITLDWALKAGNYDLKQTALSYLQVVMNQYIVRKQASPSPLPDSGGDCPADISTES